MYVGMYDLAELTLDEIISGNGGLKVFGLYYCIT
jgi:hypothetical protein